MSARGGGGGGLWGRIGAGKLDTLDRRNEELAGLYTSVQRGPDGKTIVRKPGFEDRGSLIGGAEGALRAGIQRDGYRKL